MAKIVKTDKQEQALREVNDELKTIDSLNKVLKNEDYDDFKVRFSAASEDGALNELISLPFSLFSDKLKDYRKKLIRDVNEKSKTYAIALEDRELEILGSRKKEEKVPAPEVKEEEKPGIKEERPEPSDPEEDPLVFDFGEPVSL